MRLLQTIGINLSNLKYTSQEVFVKLYFLKIGTVQLDTIKKTKKSAPFNILQFHWKTPERLEV